MDGGASRLERGREGGVEWGRGRGRPPSRGRDCNRRRRALSKARCRCGQTHTHTHTQSHTTPPPPHTHTRTRRRALSEARRRCHTVSPVRARDGGREGRRERKKPVGERGRGRGEGGRCERVLTHHQACARAHTHKHAHSTTHTAGGQYSWRASAQRRGTTIPPLSTEEHELGGE